MPGPGDWPGRNALLSGLFGVFQAGAAARLDTASIWSSLRQAAGTWQLQATGTLAGATDEEIQSAGVDALSGQSVAATGVSTYRGIAGAWLSAKQNLHQLDQDAQITAREIFTPPWSITANTAVDPRYRVRAEWEITTPDGQVFNKWGSYELTTPLTNMTDVLAQAQAQAGTAPNSDWPVGALVTGVNDYELEQI
jgi:hypothetical protein